jgi:actin-related protein
MRGMFTLKYPIQRGIVTDWDDMENLASHFLYVLFCELLCIWFSFSLSLSLSLSLNNTLFVDIY